MKKIFRVVAILLIAVSFSGCTTTKDMEPFNELKTEALDGAVSLQEEEKKIEKEDEALMVEALQKQVDIEKTIVYIEKPVYRPIEDKTNELARKKLDGQETVKEAMRSALKTPERYSSGKMFYDFDENFVYEIYCAPYRITDIELEPGEEILETPFVSEPEVWQVGAGVSKYKGLDVQHFFVKPSYSKLTTTMIIITNRRIYHILLKSFKDDYMAMVKWNYPIQMPYTIKSEMAHPDSKIKTVLEGISPEFLSFDYKMKYSPFKKPIWLPTRVYDDGRKTYIELDEKVLNAELPALFDQKNNIINYRVRKNILIVDSLITKVTLKLNKSKVIIEKKKSKSEVTK
ncbi:TrbG/VirB9 family P-type conjugative transfer protein [Treponema sp. OMZ 799]|uniref:TrbG/VirB9 family P-type conjugative transfer protein n=1 Tax=Treponema sp. OMZ 799 TaxID=2563668 RepID=UPI0020A4195B|nr:TrbG/VirB9 family P-type conjugative transfer protein [Treponema sp. OMZ 799]UTC77071.1 TrbG/VirB9 family P-type conjugative transfer protein [Treponema sp. OMZ 799]UTC78256.1 TrbG/VirB9 family P-type conjugative transfer protein [Treponema sp. OMZ 799]